MFDLPKKNDDETVNLKLFFIGVRGLETNI